MMIPVLVAVLPAVCAVTPSNVSTEVIARQGKLPVVRIQARLAGEYLLLRVKHTEGWHTYAMDNERRAEKALAGKTSLGVEQGLAIDVAGGLDLEGPWLQPQPTDMSQPELRWYTYGFGETAWFARKVKSARTDESTVRVRGQACSGDTCCPIDVTLTLPVGEQADATGDKADDESVDAILRKLIPVEPQGRSQTAGNPAESSP